MSVCCEILAKNIGQSCPINVRQTAVSVCCEMLDKLLCQFVVKCWTNCCVSLL